MTPFFHPIELQRAKEALRAGAGFIDFIDFPARKAQGESRLSNRWLLGYNWDLNIHVPGRLTGSEERATLHLGVTSSSPCVGWRDDFLKVLKLYLNKQIPKFPNGRLLSLAMRFLRVL